MIGFKVRLVKDLKVYVLKISNNELSIFQILLLVALIAGAMATDNIQENQDLDNEAATARGYGHGHGGYGHGHGGYGHGHGGYGHGHGGHGHGHGGYGHGHGGYGHGHGGYGHRGGYGHGHSGYGHGR